MSKTILVDMADFACRKAPDILRTVGIGSCVAVTLFDPAAKIGALAHIMLPSNTAGDTTKPCKFADSAIPELLKHMLRLGAEKCRIHAKIVGGARMFPAAPEGAITVGEQNLCAVKKNLEAQGIPVLAEKSGGIYARSLFFYLETGQVQVSSGSGPVITI